MNKPISPTHFDALGRFNLPAYPARRPFASFLPGIAGPLGIPLWAFYVNRGQCLASFGVQSKDSPILEFQPANKAYQLTPLHGFRTFLSITGQAGMIEPFSPLRPPESQRMAVGMGELEIEDSDPAAGWRVTVNYSGLMNEPFGALVRRLTLANTSEAPLRLSLLDGLPAVQPFGVNNWLLKEMGRTVEAWMEVFNLGAGMPFYRLRASVADTEKVENYQAGHFYLPFVEGAPQTPLAVIADSRAVFGADTAFFQPQVFQQGGLAGVAAAPQVLVGRTPCAFSGLSLVLAPGEQVRLASIFGHTADQADLPAIHQAVVAPGYLDRKGEEARAFFADLTGAVETHTAQPLFDAHLRQAYLDNVIRGGLPLVYGQDGASKVFHLYARKHGDLERDYNAFQVVPEMFSQGNANYRDVNQNRRSDVLFNPAVADSSVLTFLNLIQLDGYNPLVLKGLRLRLPEAGRAAVLAFSPAPERLAPLLEGSFTPGELLRRIRQEAIPLDVSLGVFAGAVLERAEFEQQAAFGEGFWIDHWMYNLDLIESFLSVYPERRHSLFFERQVTWFDSPAVVQPRSRKYVETPDGVRQYGAVKEDEEKAAHIAARGSQPNLARTARGEVVRSTVFAKLVFLAAIKFSTLDPSGVGIEMEAGRPGWYDALNGLPGLLGSSLVETHALLHLVRLLREVLPSGGQAVSLPVEHAALIRGLVQAVETWSAGGPAVDMKFWEARSLLREEVRANTRLGLDGRVEAISAGALEAALGSFERVLRIAIQKGSLFKLPNGDDLPPTYLVHSATAWKALEDERGIQVLAFEARPLPAFLEGVVGAMRSAAPQAAADLHARLLRSSLYDGALGMLRVNASLAGEGFAIGRVRAFPPGWLENASIWTHMSYKYLLELLRTGQHAAFYAAARQQMAPFLDPDVYGRSPLELTSFIASSAHPDPQLHGAGFVARLSGATAEMLSIWWEMFTGGRPFQELDGQLVLALRPALPAWLFDEADRVSFRFLGRTRVIYHNPSRRDLFGAARPAPVSYRLMFVDGQEETIQGAALVGPAAQKVRDGLVREIVVEI